MTTTFNITHDREFLKYFMTKQRTLSLSDEMVERLRTSDDPYGAYGYGSWLFYTANSNELRKSAEIKLLWAATNGVHDAYVPLARMYFNGTVEGDKAQPEVFAAMMDNAYKLGSEMAQYYTLLCTIYGFYGFETKPELVADILKGHIDKHPNCDPIYWTLYGRAVKENAPEQAISIFKEAINRGDPEGYFYLAVTYDGMGDKAQTANALAAAKKHDVLQAFSWYISDEDFQQLSPSEQQALHDVTDRDLHYAMSRHMALAYYRMGVDLYYGNLGYEADIVKAVHYLMKGCQLGDDYSPSLLASIYLYHNEELPDHLKVSRKQMARLFLQALRMEDYDTQNLEQVARAYVEDLLPEHKEEIEWLWLKKYMELTTADEDDDNAEATAVLQVYPQGFYYARDVASDGLDTNEMSAWIDARGLDIVHYSDLLTRLTRALCLDKQGYHLAMAVDRDGYAKDLPDNMTGTIIYGHGQEMRGTMIFFLEDGSYNIKPLKGIQLVYNLTQLLDAATGGLVRMPTSEELESIGVGDNGFEEYDDPDFSSEDDEGDTENVEDTEGAECPMPSDDNLPAQELHVLWTEAEEALLNCNLCSDTLFVKVPSEPQFAFRTSEELIESFKDAAEENIERNGGYMIDEWQFVDYRQQPMHLLSRLRFE
ncbi:MAG: sel1 repeat family protein [Bacteroidaceae bacterium]|nr:sel1 repeat family protein [Bacteroidaceae bacterium]